MKALLNNRAAPRNSTVSRCTYNDAPPNCKRSLSYRSQQCPVIRFANDNSLSSNDGSAQLTIETESAIFPI